MLQPCWSQSQSCWSVGTLCMTKPVIEQFHKRSVYITMINAQIKSSSRYNKISNQKNISQRHHPRVSPLNSPSSIMVQGNIKLFFDNTKSNPKKKRRFGKREKDDKKNNTKGETNPSIAGTVFPPFSLEFDISHNALLSFMLTVVEKKSSR